MITKMLSNYGIASKFDLNLFKVRNKDLDNSKLLDQNYVLKVPIGNDE